MTKQLLKTALALAIVMPLTYASQITFKNGDRVSGAILTSDAKTLTIKSELAGNNYLPWDQVDAITSTEPLALQLKDGQMLLGPVTTSDGKFTVQTATAGSVTAPKDA